MTSVTKWFYYIKVKVVNIVRTFKIILFSCKNNCVYFIAEKNVIVVNV